MPDSIHVVDGDFALDTRGRAIHTSGYKKLSNQINYRLSTSSYLSNLVSSFRTNSPSANEWALKDAVQKTIGMMIQEHKLNPYLPADERIKAIKELAVTRSDSTSFEFYVSVKTYVGVPFSLTIARTLN